MPKVTLLAPAKLTVAQKKLEACAWDHALDTYPNVTLVEGGMRAKWRSLLCRKFAKRTLTLPTATGLHQATRNEMELAQGHVFFGGSPEAFDTTAKNLLDPAKAGERLHLIANYTVTRVRDLDLCMQPELIAINQYTQELILRMLQLMKEKYNPLEAMQIALPEFVPHIRVGPRRSIASPSPRKERSQIGRAAARVSGRSSRGSQKGASAQSKDVF